MKALILLGALAFAADAPKTVPFSAAEQTQIQAINQRANLLQQEERAIAAERQTLQLQAEKLFDAACRAAGGEQCRPTINGDDPSKWTLTVLPKEAKK